MGNCQGKKAANVETTARSKDVNTPKTVVESPLQPETQPATPEKETVAAAPSVAKSASEAVSLAVSQSASKDTTVFTTGAETAVSAAETADEMPRSSTAKSAVSTVPSADETAVTATDQSLAHLESNLQTMPTDFTEVEKETSFLDKVDAFRDSCCGADGAAPAARDNNTSEVVESSSGVYAAASEDDTEAPSTVVPGVSADGTDASASAVGFSQSSSMASSVISSNDPNYKQKRKLTKKLREIEAIEAKDHESLSPDQQEKLATKEEVLRSLAAL